MVKALDKNKCIGCGTCVEVCPMDVFRMDSKAGHSVICYLIDCQTCYNCELECPAGAIQVSPYRKGKPLPWTKRWII